MSALLCLHSHVHINSVLSDYVPKSTLGTPSLTQLYNEKHIWFVDISTALQGQQELQHLRSTV